MPDAASMGVNASQAATVCVPGLCRREVWSFTMHGFEGLGLWGLSGLAVLGWSFGFGIGV